MVGIVPRPGTAQDASYPDRPIRLVVPFPAGGATDVVVRLLGERMSQSLGQTIIVENRTGAAGTVGAAAVARSRSDGYTILAGSLGSNLIAPLLMREPPFNPLTDFEFISTIGTTPTALLVRADGPINSVDDLLAILRREPGRQSYSSAGIGSPMHLSGVLLGIASRTEAVHVPYRGEAPAVTDMIAGQVLFCFSPSSSAVGYVRGGRVRALAVASRQRVEGLPGVPTMAEAGLPEVEAYTWQGLFAPRGTPRAVVERLNRALRAAADDPAVRARASEIGVPVAGSTPEEFRAEMEADLRKWSGVIQTAGIEKQ
ncbi:tripartite tricarboxylate transporter substrate binding protein [Roseococcus sp. SYP-B2431]|uniref:Bug family tripartite tricarboxylate transporter substrate binding protein n=1 Tax=Roseococcus sp. SYP-B2431 TaxID=2496640 RepID=UPI0013F3BEC9|nr:tripartite tricarboxylate transporter substrate binding protein [Roseococcus sp. SYP-B2431]